LNENIIERFLCTHSHLDVLQIEHGIDIPNIDQKCRVKNHPQFIGAIGCIAFPKYFAAEKPTRDIENYFNNLGGRGVLGYTCGYHPSSGNDFNKDKLLHLIDYVNKKSKVVGIGEFGLDETKHWVSMTRQMEVFEEHLVIAANYQLPLVLHIRGLYNGEAVYNNALEILDVIFRFFIYNFLESY